MMLRKRSRPAQNQGRSQQVMVDHGYDTSFSSDGSVSSPKPRAAPSFFTVPGLFLGLCSKGSSTDYDTAQSPTSPLELRGSPKLGGSTFSRSPRSPGLSPRSWWDCSRVGLGLVDSLSDGTKPYGKAQGSLGIKNILFGSKMRINIPSTNTHLDDDNPLVSGPKSLPKDYIESPFRQSGPSRSILGSGRSDLEPREYAKISSCSPDVVSSSSLPLSRLMYCSLKTNSEVVASDVKDSQLGSPLVRGGKNLDEFAGSLPIAIVGSSNGVTGSLSRSKIEDYTSTNSLPKDYVDHQTGRPKSMLGSGTTELETGELVNIHSCSTDVGASSLPLSRLMYHNHKTNSETFATGTKEAQLGSPLGKKGKNFDEILGSLPVAITPSNGFMTSLTPSEIELSEDYTCIISHGPNPKTTHIFGDCILEGHSFPSPDRKNRTEAVEEGGGSLHPTNDFLSFCLSCKKKLEEGKDIYIYRGDKAFCSCDCRDQEIMDEEEMTKPAADTSELTAASFEEEIFI